MTGVDGAGPGLAQLACLALDGPTRQALELRGNVVGMIQAAEDAALRPHDPGGLSHSLRAAIATRASRLNGHQALADHFTAGVSAKDTPLCDPVMLGDTPWLQDLLAFVDMVTVSPRDSKAAHIRSLKGAGIHDADIVRLCELTAFLAFQYRVIAGLNLMEQTL